MRRTVAVVGAAAIFAAGIGLGTMLGGTPPEPDDDGGATVLPDGLELTGALTSFDACDDYLDHVQEHALELVTPYGLHGGPMPMRGEMAVDDAAEDSADGGADMDTGAAPTAGTTPDDVSGTNVQEQGVDEPDRLKTDGEVAYTTIGGRLRVLDITGDDPEELATLELEGGWGAELLLAGDRLLVTSGGGPVLPFAGESFSADRGMPVPGGGATTLTSIDVSDPSAPEVTERLTLDGATLSSRMVDGIARVVIRTEPGINIPWQQPEAGGLRAERGALEANRELIRGSDADDWLPYFVHETADGSEQEGILIDCERVAHPAAFSGLGTLSVLTVDVDAGSLIPDDGGVGVLAGGDTVYASPERLYVATQRFIDPVILEEAATSDDRPGELDEVTTEIHAFDISAPTGTDYLASGEVPGVLLDQWALSEHDGVLRVASTIGDRWWGGGEDSSSLVTTLEQDGDELVQLGQVGDLGPTERIFAVRFLGEVGYVVTFRQTDPLYVIDLTDPSAPETTGELKIAGYSAYLHPLGDGLLLGVGQDAEEETGRTLGTQVSLFDVADPKDPQRLDTLTVADSGSDVEHDHRAFLHWPDTGLSVVPLTRWWHPESEDAEPPEGPPNGALAFTASRDGFAPAAGGDPEALALTHAEDDLAEDGSMRSDAELIDRWHSQYDAAIQRSMVVGDRLLTFSERKVVAHDLDSLEERGSLTLR
ncbi:MAG: beta-propeller domain-containing protein [Nitriliruptoraceae bacterium]